MEVVIDSEAELEELAVEADPEVGEVLDLKGLVRGVLDVDWTGDTVDEFVVLVAEAGVLPEAVVKLVALVPVVGVFTAVWLPVEGVAVVADVGEGVGVVAGAEVFAAAGLPPTRVPMPQGIAAPPG